MGISIHALVRSATPPANAPQHSTSISIHALVRSATLLNPAENNLQIDFNPRTREECDNKRIGQSKNQVYFNPRTREECDAIMEGEFDKSGDFNPRTREECDR